MYTLQTELIVYLLGQCQLCRQFNFIRAKWNHFQLQKCRSIFKNIFRTSEFSLCGHCKCITL